MFAKMGIVALRTLRMFDPGGFFPPATFSFEVFFLIPARVRIGSTAAAVVFTNALDNMLTLAAQITGRLKELTAGEGAPDKLSVTFGVRVDGSAAVSVARQGDIAQFTITAEWESD